MREEWLEKKEKPASHSVDTLADTADKAKGGLIMNSTITTSVFIGGPLYADAATAVTNLKASTFAEVVGWAGLESNGDVVYQGTAIASGGSYTGARSWPSQLAELTDSGIRLQIMLGGWGNPSFDNAKALIFPSPGDYPDNPQIGPNTILYKNFKALKSAIPGLDGINFDDEQTYDQPTTVNLAKLLASVGLDATCNPYTMMDFWVGCLAAAPEAITRFYLQCYAGGTGNNPKNWIDAVAAKMGPGFDADGFVYPSLWCRHGTGCTDGSTPANFQNQFKSWKPNGILGGWMWIYDDAENCEAKTGYTLKDYATAIVEGINL